MNLQGMWDIEEGDVVFVVHYGSWSKIISMRKVTKVTPKQFRCGDYYKFRKSDGKELGGSVSYADYAYPDNPQNRAEYEEYLEEQRIKARTRDLLAEILPAIRKLREEDLPTIEKIAELLEVTLEIKDDHG